MGEACRTRDNTKNSYKILVGTPERKRQFGGLGVDGRILLKCIL
jgi:hypothetical protein